MNFIVRLLTLVNQLHIYHWQTESGWHHAKFGDAYGALDGLVDNFVEVFMGKHGKVISKNGFPLSLVNMSNKSAEEFIDENITYLTNELTSVIEEKDTDLLNIRDEMIAELNKLKYLISLK